MRKCFCTAASAGCLLGLLITTTGFAQGIRSDHTFYVLPKIGLVQYTGDQDRRLFDLWDLSDGGGSDEGNALPWGAGLEVGYQFSPWSLGIEGAMGTYPAADDDAESDRGKAYQAKLIGRYTFGYYNARIAPFAEAGIFATTATQGRLRDEGKKPGFGPLLGIGLDFKVTDRLSLLVEAQGMFSFPDDAFDGDASNPGGEDNRSGSNLRSEEDGPCQCEVPDGGNVQDGGNVRGRFFESFDMLNTLSVGLKYNFKRAVIPPVVSALSCPEYVMEGDVATFTASVDVGATAPLEYHWRFGTNGDTGTGLTTSYTFTEPGTYTVFFTVANAGGDDSEICTIDVARRPVLPEITALLAKPNRFTACEPVSVTFGASTRGDAPLTYAWDFGDGTRATGPNPRHTYSKAGRYDVTLTLSGASGETATASTVIEVEACDETDCDDIAELNTVYFAPNSSVLTSEGRAALAENIDILREVPDLCARIEAWAGPRERNARALVEARARAVVEFFQHSGIEPSRLVTVGGAGLGMIASPKDGAQGGRVDVIPLCCEMQER